MAADGRTQVPLASHAGRVIRERERARSSKACVCRSQCEEQELRMLEAGDDRERWPLASFSVDVSFDPHSQS